MFFKKNNTKSTIIEKMYMKVEDEGGYSKSTDNNLNMEDFFSTLKDLANSHNKLVIERITEDNHVYLTTTNSVRYSNEESRIDDISELIKDYIRGNAISMKAYTLMIDGELKDVFTEHIKAKASKSRYIREGVNENSIEINEIYIK